MGDETSLTFEEKLLRDAFAELLLEMRQVGETAPDGTGLDAIEGLALNKGRELLRRTMENQLQTAVETAEKKGPRPARPAKRSRATKGPGREPC
ncbi:MAG: hypothetical protein ACRDD1_06425 [Planctomycetia bacterium]